MPFGSCKSSGPAAAAADEIIAQGIVQPAILEIEDRVRTARSSHSGAASSSSAAAPRRQVTVSSAAAAAGPEDEHEKKGKSGRPKSVQPAIRVSTEPEDSHEAKPSRARSSRAVSRGPRQAEPVGERIDITTEIQKFKKKKDWDKYDEKELRTQLKLRKSKDYKATAVNKMDKEDIIEILMIMDVGKTGL